MMTAKLRGKTQKSSRLPTRTADKSVHTQYSEKQLSFRKCLIERPVNRF